MGEIDEPRTLNQKVQNERQLLLLESMQSERRVIRLNALVGKVLIAVVLMTLFLLPGASLVCAGRL